MHKKGDIVTAKNFGTQRIYLVLSSEVVEGRYQLQLSINNILGPRIDMFCCTSDVLVSSAQD